ncbi:hypothetical protein [Aeromicrobium sp.]|uniref:hypothetical protein n=1 Tax=Aeromicrobium sp. TaxID=1871063 RepID=UPI002FCA6F05
MVTSNYMPNVVVEVAFDSGYSTAAASRTWTDISDYVELEQGITITHGRADEFGTCDANELRLTLENRDGRFTLGKTGGAYYPNVKIGRPIRVTSTPVGGIASVRFLGYVDEWPVAWDGTDATAWAQITAHSRIARLGFGAELRGSNIQAVYLDGAPSAYYPLSEEAGATQATDASGNGAPMWYETSTGTSVFSGASGPLGLGTAANLRTPTKQLTGAVAANTTTGVLLEGFANVDTASAMSQVRVYNDTVTDSGTPTYLNVGTILATGFLSAQLYDAATGTIVTVTGAVDNRAAGFFHFAARAIRVAGTTTVTLYRNGVSVGSSASAVPGAITFNKLAAKSNTGDDYDLAHVAINANLATIADRAESGANAFANETASARITRLARYAGVPSGELSVDSGTGALTAFDTAGSTALDVMRTVEETEGGVLYDARDNTLTFKGRAARYNTASAFTLSAADQELQADISPRADRSLLANDVSATSADGSVSRVIDQASIDAYGYARTSLDLAASVDAAYQAAAMRVARYKEPATRIPTLGVNLMPLSVGDQAAVLAATVGTKMTAAGLPAQAPASSIDFFIEGYTETIGHESYGFVFNVSPTTPGYDVFVLDDATRGLLDGSYVLAQ